MLRCVLRTGNVCCTLSFDKESVGRELDYVKLMAVSVLKKGVLRGL